MGSNIVEFSHTQIFKSFKILIGVAFVLGGWFTTLQINQLKVDERSLNNEREIGTMKKQVNEINMNTYKDITEIKNMLNEMSIYYKQSQEKIEKLEQK